MVHPPLLFFLFQDFPEIHPSLGPGIVGPRWHSGGLIWFLTAFSHRQETGFSVSPSTSDMVLVKSGSPVLQWPPLACSGSPFFLCWPIHLTGLSSAAC